METGILDVLAIAFAWCFPLLFIPLFFPHVLIAIDKGIRKGPPRDLRAEAREKAKCERFTALLIADAKSRKAPTSH